MGVDLREQHEHARWLFECADEVTGLPVSHLCEAGPLERLTATDVAQPAVVTTSLAALAVLRALTDSDWQPDALAGHSVGEIAAYVAAGALDEMDALRLVQVRAQSMADACARVDGTMAAVIGLDEEPLRQACAEATDASGSVEVANLNAPGQLVISGERRAVERAGERAKAAGARRVLPLNVGGPFHSAYMRASAEAVQVAADGVALRDARVPVVLNTSAAPATRAADLRVELSMQVYAPVRWSASLQRMAELGCDRFLEVGPQQVLAGLVKRTLPNARVASFGSLADLEQARALLAG